MKQDARAGPCYGGSASKLAQCFYVLLLFGYIIHLQTKVVRLEMRESTWKEAERKGENIVLLESLHSQPACKSAESAPEFQHEVCILTMVRPDGFRARECQRHFCRKSIYDNFNTSQLVHKFVVGLPSYNNHKNPSRKVQGEKGTAKEINVSLKILNEIQEYHDVLVSPNRDHYVDKSSKRLFIMKWGVAHKCRFTFKVDDEYCVNAQDLFDLIHKHDREHPQNELHIGFHRFSGTEYAIMKGPHNETYPFMSGHFNGLSFKTSQMIIDDDSDDGGYWSRAVLTAAHGTSSEDRNLGAWITEISQKHNFSVDWVTNRKLKFQYPEQCKNESLPIVGDGSS